MPTATNSKIPTGDLSGDPSKNLAKLQTRYIHFGTCYAYTITLLFPKSIEDICENVCIIDQLPEKIEAIKETANTVKFFLYRQH